MDIQFKMTAEPSTQSITTSCVIDAPRHLVFTAFMDPILIERWWGPKHLTTTVDVFDACTGGSWRFLLSDNEGRESGFHGVFHSIIDQESIVQTFEFENAPGHVILDTITFEDVDGKTRITDRSVFQTPEDRDDMLSDNMEAAAESMQALNEMLEAMKKAVH